MAALDELRNFNLQKLREKLSLEDNEFDQWLENLGLLHARRTCPNCGGGTSVRAIAGRRYGVWRSRFVEIDEILVVKRKYGVGRVLAKQEVWLFGGVERDTNWQRVFMVPVESRTAGRLLPLIQQYVLPGTTIVSDEWRPYRGIPTLPQGYVHWKVNYSRNFVNPANPQAHTQNVESMWKKLKRNFKQHFENTTNTYDTYFPEFVWRQQFGDRDNVFFNFWSQLTTIYPCERVP
ncbi:hypothetical protein niasHT_014191 [Heterodera trifolii]|uniref:ISXO2-like transposase domain-containing protein n=1 Tax=Heterodera trifolii TaxID=157864 RepID=A0ABD2KX13_9BILA